MRPDILYPLFASISSLKGIGPRTAGLYQKLCGSHVVHLLWHLPSGLVDRRYSPPLALAESGRVATLTVKIVEHQPPPRPRRPYRILTSDGVTSLTLTFFNAKGDYLAKIYPLGTSIVISGVLERYKTGWNMNHPDYAVPESRRNEIPLVEPIYPLTEGLTGKMVRKTIQQALSLTPSLPEWIWPSLQQQEKWPNWLTSLRIAHDVSTDIEKPTEKSSRVHALRRLAYDELLADQLGLALIRRHHKLSGGRPHTGSGILQERLIASLPFSLTGSQKQAVADIDLDLGAPKRMLRLLQGDVGAGKTIVALLAMLRVIESGAQAALMVPTEILAKQHHTKLSQLLQPLGLEIGLLTGKSRGTEGRSQTLQRLSNGSLKMVIGTHALFQNDINFQDLGLVIIDEQHRFGVNQRLQLSDKGQGVDILVMTATPIPRTLTLTAFGDMDVSRLSEKPAGRQTIDTRLIDQNRLAEVIEGVRRQIAHGAQIYWVCPLIDESEVSDLTAATERATLLAQTLGAEHVGLIHGKMATDEKDKIMSSFVNGTLKLLVATTVIEVGMDVPNATLMIVEHAERFGLSQLHQLRGRVGRGREKSNCLLMYQSPLGEIAKARLTLLRESDDGFHIAEEDLRLRGPGELLGTRQSGLPEFKLANLARDQDLLQWARREAETILEKDPHLHEDRGKALRTLLYLFEKDAAIPLLGAG